MTRRALNEDEPACSRLLVDVVDLERDLVVRAPYASPKILVGGTVQHCAEHDGAVMQLVSDWNDDRAHPARVCEGARATNRITRRRCLTGEHGRQR